MECQTPQFIHIGHWDDAQQLCSGWFLTIVGSIILTILWWMVLYNCVGHGS